MTWRCEHFVNRDEHRCLKCDPYSDDEIEEMKQDARNEATETIVAWLKGTSSSMSSLEATLSRYVRDGDSASIITLEVAAAIERGEHLK